jgi:hypothetical protein
MASAASSWKCKVLQGYAVEAVKIPLGSVAASPATSARC